MSSLSPEEGRLFACVKDNNDALAELVKRYMNLVYSIASGFNGRGESYEDLVQVGSLGLVKAIRRFDPSRDVRFSTYAFPYISGEIRRHFRDNVVQLKIPRGIRELAAKLEEVKYSSLNDGKKKSIQELAELVDATVDEATLALASLKGRHVASLDQPFDEMDLSEIIGEEDVGYTQVECWAMLKSVLPGLSPKKRNVLYQKYFMDRTQDEIAGELGVSQMHVSRLLNGAKENGTVNKTEEQILALLRNECAGVSRRSLKSITRLSGGAVDYALRKLVREKRVDVEYGAYSAGDWFTLAASKRG